MGDTDARGPDRAAGAARRSATPTTSTPPRGIRGSGAGCRSSSRRRAPSGRSGSTTALERIEAGLELAFATVLLETGTAVGSTRFLALRPEHRSVEIGWTWLAPSAWGTGANTEAKLLQLEHAFEVLGCRRVEFKTDALNERANPALAALPARFEGIHRKHMLVRDGENRDSAWYSVVDDEWPTVRRALRERLGVA